MIRMGAAAEAADERIADLEAKLAAAQRAIEIKDAVIAELRGLVGAGVGTQHAGMTPPPLGRTGGNGKNGDHHDLLEWARRRRVTLKQHAALQGIARNLTIREFGEIMGLKISGAKMHYRATLNKLGIERKSEAIGLARDMVRRVDPKEYLEQVGIPVDWIDRWRDLPEETELVRHTG